MTQTTEPTNKHWSFLKEGDTSFGLFYPLHYTLAGFLDPDQAQTALDRLAESGFSTDDLHVVSGAQLIAAIDEIEDGNNWLDRVRARIADFLGTETYFIDQDLTLARQGGVFLLAYTPEDDSAKAVQGVLEGARPVYARRYLRMAIDRIIEPANTDDVPMRD